MSLNCVVGEATCNKDKYIYTQAARLEASGVCPIIFVPSQARMASEEAYFNITNKSGMMDTNVTTLSRYVSNILGKEDIEKEYISDEEKRIYIKQIINENKDDLVLFKKIADKPSFVDLIISYSDAIKRDNIDITKFEEIDNVSNLTKEKLKEISCICKILDKKLNEKYIDSLDMLDIFNDYIINNTKEFENKEIFFHGYNNFSQKEFDVIKSLVNAGVNVTISLTIPYDLIISGESKDGIFEIVYDTYIKLNKLARTSGTKFNIITDLDNIDNKEDIKFLTENIFSSKYIKYDKSSKNVSLRIEKNLNYEIEQIAQDIVQKTREDSDIRFKDFAIYTSNFEEYEFCVKRIFKNYNIEYSFDDETEVQLSNFSIYILTLLKMLAENRIDISNLFVLLKTGLYDISEEDLSYLENYISEFGIKSYMLNKPFIKNNKEGISYGVEYDLTRLNNIREKIITDFLKLMDGFSMKMNSKEIVEKLYTHIKESQVINRYASEINSTNNISLKHGEFKRQIVQAVYEVFDNIVKACGENLISVDTFKELFEFGIKDKKIKTIPMTIDQVEICDINKTRILPRKYVYIVGAYDRGLPIISEEDIMFSDKELKQLKEKNIELKQDSIVRTNMALFNIYLSLATVIDKLVISMPASKITGEPLRPGIVINEVKRILNIPMLGNITNEDKSNIDFSRMTDNVVFTTLLKNIVKLEELEENKVEKEKLQQLYDIYTYYTKYSDKEEYRDILEYARKDENLSNENLSKLYGEKINSSVSKLETFKKCPFSYYANYILNIKPLKKYNMTIIDMGTLMHDVLENFSKWLLERSYAWQQIINEDDVGKLAREKINNIIEKIFEEKYSKYKESNRYIVLKSSLKKKMFKIITIIAKSFNQSDFKPLGYEIEFKAGGLYSPIEVNLENGKTMYLLGKIDRVDTACINDKVYVRIIDYKSSNRTISLNDIKEGISLQLMTYMSAIINNHENIDKQRECIPASINYFSLKSNIKKISEYEADMEEINKQLIKEMKLKGIYLSDVKVLESLDRKYKDTNHSFLDINSRNIKDENKVISEERFKEECLNIKEILKDIGREITNGVTKINPKKCNGKIPCEYCEYLTICRKDIRA